MLGALGELRAHQRAGPLDLRLQIDHGLQQGKQFEAAMGGEDGMKKLADLSVAAIESSESNVFAFNPRMSYVPDEWIKADPDFWKPKQVTAPAAKAAAEDKKEKPAQ